MPRVPLIKAKSGRTASALYLRLSTVLAIEPSGAASFSPAGGFSATSLPSDLTRDRSLRWESQASDKPAKVVKVASPILLTGTKAWAENPMGTAFCSFSPPATFKQIATTLKSPLPFTVRWQNINMLGEPKTTGKQPRATASNTYGDRAKS